MDDLTEKVWALDGSLARARERAAVRLEDLAGLMTLAGKLQSSAVTAAPTAAQHNQLVRDVHELHNRLTEVVEALQRRLLA
ncbi:hypothetical protein BN1110_06280 [bacterium YEK0313]|nr:hypothetical protein BN1110_06280 [bacterium YEK0313]